MEKEKEKEKEGDKGTKSPDQVRPGSQEEVDIRLMIHHYDKIDDC